MAGEENDEAHAEQQALTAHCTRCGAGVPLTLAGPLPGCRHCGNTQPLSAEIAAKLSAVRGRLEQRAAQHRQMTSMLIAKAAGFHGMTIAITVTSWLLFGGMALGFALSGEADLPTLMFGEVRGMDLAGRWWTLFGVAVGFPASIVALGVTTFWLRGLAAGALPLAPTHAGAPPRCRCCGAELPDGAALRRCRFCGADCLVLGEHYQKVEGDLDSALSAMKTRFGLSLASRIRRAESVLWAGSLVPIGALLAMPPIGLVSGTTFPPLWVIPAAMTVLALVSMMLPLTRRLPPIDPLECLALGSDGRSHDLIVHVSSAPTGPKTTVWNVNRGGESLDAATAAKLVPVDFASSGPGDGSGARHFEGRAAWDGGSLRVWDVAAPTIGTPPLWTARRRSEPTIVFV